MTNLPKKLYPGVMISSTFNDLVQHRAALITALQKEDLFPIGMETHVARTGDDVISSSLHMIEKSAAYIGLVSHRYGQVIADESLNANGYSVTRLEYEKAQSLGLPTLIFIMHDDHAVKKSEVEIDPVKIKKLNDFKEEVKKGRIYTEFKDLESFSKDAIHLVAQLRREIESGYSTNKKSKLVTADDNAAVTAPELYAQPPYVGSHAFVGRRAELEQLDDWASYSDPHPILLFEAIGGSGKSMLTWEWVNNYASKNRSDWAGKFWYSFYERGAQLSDFCRHALAYITGKPFKLFERKKMPELTELLLKQLRKRPWLLLLDGLERILVAYHRIDAAEIPDEELNAPTDLIINRDPRAAIRPEDDDLLRALASANPSKMLISSRLIPKVLVNPSGQPITGVQRIFLTGLRPQDAEALIRSCGVVGEAQKIQHYLSKHCACHPLVTGILAGLIIDYLPDKGNFDAWEADSITGGGKLNLGDLDLVQKRNHILKVAFENLSDECRQLLSMLSFITDAIDYPTLCAFNPHNMIENDDGLSSKTANRLQKTVKDLELRGFLQYDGKYYNLHPVVRGVVFGKMRLEEKLKYGQKAVDFFSQQSHPPFEEAETLEDVRSVLNAVTVLQKMGRFQAAADVYRGNLSHALLFNLEAYVEIISTLKPFFPNSLTAIPDSVSLDDASYLVNDLAFALGHLDKHREALSIYNTVLEIGLLSKNWSRVCGAIISICWTFTKMGQLGREKEYLEWAIELSDLAELEEDSFIAHLFRFDYLFKTGMYEDAQKEWNNLEKFTGRVWSRERYRPGVMEYGFCHYRFRIGQLEKEHLERAEKLSLSGRNRVNTRYLLLLRGMWYVDQQKWALAEQCLQKEVEMSRAIGSTNAATETLLALTKLKMGVLQDPANRAIELSNVKDPHDLFLAELWEAIGDTEKAAKHATVAYRKYWGDGEPYVDRYYLERTKKLLRKIGVTPPILAPYNPKKTAPHSVEAKLMKALEKLRKEKESKRDDR